MIGVKYSSKSCPTLFFFYQILKIQFDHFSQLCSCLYTINALVYTCRNRFDLLESDKRSTLHLRCIFKVYNIYCHINILMCLDFYYSAFITFDAKKKKNLKDRF